MWMKKQFLIVLFFFAFVSLKAQNNTDFQYRFAPSIDYKINKKWKVGFDYRYALEKDFSTFQASVFQVAGEYKINKKMTLEAGYRFSTSTKIDNQRLFASFMFDYKVKKITFSSRTKYQFSTAYFNSDYWNEFDRPNQYLRQKFTIDYNIPKSKISVNFSPEFFIKWDQTRFLYNRTRYNIGTNYKLKYGNTIGLALLYEDKLNPIKNDRFILTTKYNLSIDELWKNPNKKDKKKNKEKE